METSKRLTSQQRVLAASGALVVGSAMLSHGNRLGLVLVAIAAACAVVGFLRRARD